MCFDIKIGIELRMKKSAVHPLLFCVTDPSKAELSSHVILFVLCLFPTFHVESNHCSRVFQSF